MLTVKECLSTICLQKYMLHDDKQNIIGSIERVKSGEETKLVFSNEYVLNYLSSDVRRIVPDVSTDDGFCLYCILELDFELPFY